MTSGTDRPLIAVSRHVYDVLVVPDFVIDDALKFLILAYYANPHEPVAQGNRKKKRSAG